MRRYFLISAILLFFGSTVLAQSPDHFSFRKTYKTKLPAELSITTNDGFIHVRSTDQNETEVFFIVKKDNKILKMDLEELREHLEVEIENDGNQLEIIVKQNKSDWVKNWKDRYNVSFYINAPRNTSCELKTSDGDIDLQDFEGDQLCKTSDGNITVRKISGDLNAQTSDGDINVSEIHGSGTLSTSDGNINATNIQGKLNCKTSDGDIHAMEITNGITAVTSDGDISLTQVIGDNSARTSDGNIVFEDMTGSLSAQTSDGDIRGDFKLLKDDLFLKTSDGNISVTIPDGLGLDLELKGEDINTRLDNFSGDTSDHHITGKIRSGGIMVELITSDGNINLNYK